jgi:hypothetical protein
MNDGSNLPRASTANCGNRSLRTNRMWSSAGRSRRTASARRRSACVARPSAFDAGKNRRDASFKLTLLAAPSSTHHTGVRVAASAIRVAVGAHRMFEFHPG